jgi:hypothetical protein
MGFSVSFLPGRCKDDALKMLQLPTYTFPLPFITYEVIFCSFHPWEEVD